MYINHVEIPAKRGGGGGYFCVQKMEIPGRSGNLHEIPSVVGVWIFSGTTHTYFFHLDTRLVPQMIL